MAGWVGVSCGSCLAEGEREDLKEWFQGASPNDKETEMGVVAMYNVYQWTDILMFVIPLCAALIAAAYIIRK